MAESRVAIRYARALFELTSEKTQLEPVVSDLKSVRKMYEGSPEFRALLDSPVIPKDEKLKVANRLFRSTLQPITFNFLRLLIEKTRENLLFDVVDQFQELVDESMGVLRGELITAYPFSTEQLDSLKKKLDEETGKDVLLEQRVDESLIGGFVVRLKDTVIDNSLKNQLTKLRTRLRRGA